MNSKERTPWNLINLLGIWILFNIDSNNRPTPTLHGDRDDQLCNRPHVNSIESFNGQLCLLDPFIHHFFGMRLSRQTVHSWVYPTPIISSTCHKIFIKLRHPLASKFIKLFTLFPSLFVQSCSKDMYSSSLYIVEETRLK